MNILLFGPPGAGKGTQSEFLVSRLNMKHISTGDLFRAAIKSKTQLGIEAKSYMDKGELVPDSVTINMVKEVLRNAQGQDFVLDGFPRNVQQANSLEKLLNSLDIVLEKAVFLEVNIDLLVKRLSGRRLCRKCGAVYHIETKKLKDGRTCDVCGSSEIYQRDDDKAESINTRLRVYEESTQPLKDYYREKNLLVSVDGMGTVEGVYERLKEAIGS